MSENNINKSIRLIDLVPNEWFSVKEKSSIWISCYRIFRTLANFSSGCITIKLPNVSAVILLGKVHYLDSSLARIEYITEEQWSFDVSKIQERDTPEGTYLLLLTPFDIDGQEGNEPAVKQLLQETVALLISINGRNIAFEHIFDNIAPMNGGPLTVISPVSENPLWFPAFELSDNRISKITNAAKTIDLLPKEQGNRIKLSLRWFESAMRQSGVDSFLSYWIALETLSMDSTDIRPINEILAKIYGLSNFKEAKSTFGVGHIFGLRGLIVHQGQIIPIHAVLQKYMGALYTDILLEKLGLPSEYQTKAVLDDPTFDFQTYIVAYLSKYEK
ncbi:hypothetical protein A6769_33175 [Nostoc punctiforme NIES-2108]|uniref:Uncharacterized protein n=1 Tax=Nostoc punctiforme NIES-2108 TaxID=1356359 RepID=A0A367R4H2_NOSPU|nr:hypothetical protein A6769_33175 [Nostoc punctiforme NIES-2108]